MIEKEIFMRLFFAICFAQTSVADFYRLTLHLRGEALSGSFTRRENLHLTLAFLGETQNLQGAQRALSALESPPFTLHFEGLGSFRRDGGDLYWLGARQCEQLTALHRQLATLLRAEGFRLEQRPFRPHLTLGRRVVLPPTFDRAVFSQRISPTRAEVRSVTLMQSSRVDGRLIYTPLNEKLLEERKK